MAIGGVVLGNALEIEEPRAAEIIGVIGFMPALLARDAAIGHATKADAVFEAGYVMRKPMTALIAEIVKG